MAAISKIAQKKCFWQSKSMLAQVSQGSNTRKCPVLREGRRRSGVGERFFINNTMWNGESISMNIYICIESMVDSIESRVIQNRSFGCKTKPLMREILPISQ
jgi:hypothetical protein